MYHPLLQTCRTFQPDVIVADMTTLAAHDVAEKLKVPLALLGSMPLSLALDLTGVLGLTSGAPCSCNCSCHKPAGQSSCANRRCSAVQAAFTALVDNTP